MKPTFTVLAAVTAASFSISAAAAATVDMGIGYALGTGGTTISRIDDLQAPDIGKTISLTLDGAPLSVNGITYRPNTGGFNAYKNAGNVVYSIDIDTGVATQVVAASGSNDAGQVVRTTTGAIGFDFNNALDAARIVSTNEENLVFFPERSAAEPARIIRATDLFYNVGDANEGTDPTVFANAYSNALPQAQVDASTQVQYVLDSGLDVLATLDNNAGSLNTLGSLTLDGAALNFNSVGGLDILTAPDGSDIAIALLNFRGMSQLFTFNLPTGSGPVAVTSLGSIGAGFSSFAVAPAPIPLPAAGLLLLAGLGGLGAIRRFRKG